jgi:hypothetical protein
MEEPMPKGQVPKTTTLESGAYLDGLFQEFHGEAGRYQELAGHQMQIEARLELTEKKLSLIRDHLEMALKTTEGGAGEERLAEFKRMSAKVRFVGMKLVDACTIVLKEQQKMTPQEMLDAINHGMFRFRTNAPLREIHAALLRHPHVKRVGGCLVWNGPKEQKEEPQAIALPPRQAKAITPLPIQESMPEQKEVKPN